MNIQEQNIVTAADSLLAQSSAAAIYLPLAEGKALYMGGPADIASMLPDQGGEIPLCEQGNFYTIAKERGFTDFGMTLSGNFSNDALQKLSEQYDASLDGQPDQGGAAVRGEEVALTDAQIGNFWMNRDCMDAIRAGDVVAQFVSAFRAGMKAIGVSARAADAPSEPSVRRADAYKLASRLQSFADRLCNDQTIGTRYEGDEAELRTAIHFIRSSGRAADAPSEPSELRQALIDVRHAIQFSHDSVGGIDKMPVMMHHAGTVVEFIDGVLKSRAADALDSQPTSLQSRLDRAERALLRAGFQDLGGQEWKPPLGPAPRFIEVPTVAAQQGSIADDAQFVKLLAAYDAAIYPEQKALRLASLINCINSRASSAPVAPIARIADLEAQLAECVALSQKWASAAGEADGRAEKMREELSNTLQFLGDMHSMPVDWTIRESQVVYGRIRDLILPPQQEGSEAGNA
jgi:hypothetical protein